jgi:tetratricopeptide (TPR) repeat protein
MKIKRIKQYKMILVLFNKTKFLFVFLALFVTIANAKKLPEADYPIENYLTDYDSLNQTEELMNQQKTRLKSQWDVLCEKVDKIPANISENKAGYVLLDELLKRAKNKTDKLDNLQKYEPIFPLGGAASLAIYGVAYEMVWNKEEDRSAKLFKFLINENNQNGFTVGNSHYWFARHLYFVKKDSTNALNHYLQVHKYPSCLVFTDAAYCRAGGIYNEFGKRDTALALYSIKIPHIDHWQREIWKAERSFKIAIQQEDYSNAIYQIERKNIALAATKSTNKFNSLRWEIEVENTIIKNMRSKVAVGLNKKQFFKQPSKKNAGKIYKDVSKHIKAFASPDSYEIQCIKQALDGPEKGKENLLLKEMLLHAWPMIEDVDPVILTNRVLSNNIFKHKERKL